VAWWWVAHLDGACDRFFLVVVIGDGSEIGWWWLRRI
ncbi:hypothetical protein A2U01_0099338, partial [Trifolium medium]|nr:hypothetical protein [Trifolium medium]